MKSSSLIQPLNAVATYRAFFRLHRSRHNIPGLVAFVQRGCPACASYKPNLEWAAKEYTALKGKHVPMRTVTVTSQNEAQWNKVLDRLGVSVFPFTVIVSPQLIMGLAGYQSKRGLKENLDFVLKIR